MVLRNLKVNKITDVKHPFESEPSRKFKMISKKNEQYGYICFNALWCVSLLFFSCMSTFWCYQALRTYISQPVSTSVSIVKNESFTWPSITVCPHQSCYNKTILNNLGMKYNLTQYDLSYWNYQPFDLTSSNFNWEKYNYSQILSEAKYNAREDILYKCIYFNTDYYADSIRNCWYISSQLGTWKSYRTQDGFCHTFNAIPAVSEGNYISILLNYKLCD